MWESFVKDWDQAIQRELVDFVGLVDQWFDIFHIFEAVEDQSQLVSSNLTVVKEEAIDDVMVQNLASSRQSSTISVIEDVIVQAERLLVDLV